MAQTNTPAAGGYGFESDDVKVNPFSFGLNTDCVLTKFEWIPNGGKEGAEQEALDIIFNINGTEKSYRKFPVVKAFGKNNEEITDPNAPEFKEAMQDFNSTLVHILHCFVDNDTTKAAMNRPFNSFKEYAKVCMEILPKDFKTRPLHIFMQWGWQLGEKERTYLEIPSKMKSGRWLSAAIPGTWKENKVENPGDQVREALYYTNEKNEKHVFVRNGWFMNSNYAKPQRRDGGAGDSGASASSNDSTNTAAASNMQQSEKKASAW